MASTDTFLVPEAAHDELVAAAYRCRGFHPDEVEAMVRLCREAARHGIRTHNVIKALHLDDLFGTPHGGCVPGAVVERRSGRFPASEAWVAHRKPGPAVAYAAIDTCIDLAGRYGVGMVSVDEAWHYLWGGAYVLEAARWGYIGFTQCTALLAEVVPYGGRRPTLGTNPHSWAFPTNDILGFPILVDFATSAIAMGRVQQFEREGKPLPPGTAVDNSGRETLDPSKASALLPFGGHKGFGLGLINELFGGIIGGFLPTLRGRFADGGDAKRTAAFFFLAIHPEALSATSNPAGLGWSANLRRILDDILAGNEGTILPGALEARAAERCARLGGLVFTAAELDSLDAIARAAGRSPWDRARLKRVAEPDRAS
ncbi:MAG: Ldh family oxidoreductase [Limisphaerales bacterium]